MSLVHPHPRLNSTCLHPPTLVRFTPPPLGQGFDAITPAQEAALTAATTAPKTNGTENSRKEEHSDDGHCNEIVELQYSVHKLSASMKAELRAILPELSTRRKRSNNIARPSSAASSSLSSSASSASVAASSTPLPSVPLTASEFKSLLLLAIPTFQHARCDLLHVCPEVEQEKARLLESFYAFARPVCSKLRAVGQWADLIEPCSGYPLLGEHGSGVYGEVDAAQVLLCYRMEQVGTCCMIHHPKWGLSHYPASFLTDASLEQTREAIEQTLNELNANNKNSNSSHHTPVREDKQSTDRSLATSTPKKPPSRIPVSQPLQDLPAL